MQDNNLAVQEAIELAKIGNKAAEKMASLNEEQIDNILKNMVRVAEENAYFLAVLSCEETGFGNVEDKTYKNHMASYRLYQNMKDKKTIGVIREDKEKRILEVAHPVGLIMGIVPSTNPTATIIYKSMIAIKSGNAIIFSPHPGAKKCGLEAVRLMAEAAEEAGAPKGVITCLTQGSLDGTKALMHSDEVKLIIATGGPAMVKSAYSSGKPAIGVGAGNSPAYIEKTANVKDAVEKIILSKTFDYGTICASEQSIVCEEANFDEVVRHLENKGGYFLTKEEVKTVCELIFKKGTTTMDAQFVGKSAKYIAKCAGIQVPENTKVLIGPQGGVGPEYPLSYEKLTSVLGFYVVKDSKEACKLCSDLLTHGMGHTLSIHTENPKIVLDFAVKPASRILINTGGTTGGTGLSTNMDIAFTLGCGTCGGSSVSENIGPQHLINIKKIAFGVRDDRTVVENDTVFQEKILKKIKNNHCSPVCNEEKLRTCTNTYEKSEDITDEKIAEAIRKVLAEMQCN